MLSVLFVPILTAALLVVLFLLLSPKRKQDMPAAAQYQIKRALGLIEEAADPNGKPFFRKLDGFVSRAKAYLERAALDDAYDLTLPVAALTEARRTTQALTLVLPPDAQNALHAVRRRLLAAAEHLTRYCGIAPTGAHRSSMTQFSRHAKTERAKQVLRDLPPQEKD